MSEPKSRSVRYEKVTLICATETYRDINDPANPMEAMNFIETGASDCTILEYHSEELHFHETETKPDNCIGAGVCVQKADMESLESEVE
jgi:hypothetical protein